MTIENLEELRERLLREERVQHMERVRAYEIYEMRGGLPGWDAHDWLQAEVEVLAFLIAHESSREDEKTAAQTAHQLRAPKASAKESKPRATSESTAPKSKVKKKTATKRAASKKTEPKPKTKRTR